MIPAGSVLRPGCAAEVAREHHQGGIEHAALLEVADEAGDRFIDRAAALLVVLHVDVRIPTAVAAAAVAELDVADALFHQPPRHQQLPAEIVRLLFADTVEIQYVLGFVREVHHFGRGELHARRQFVRLHAAGDVRVDRIRLAEFLIESRQRLHLQFALGGGAAFRRIQIRNRRVARAKRCGGRRSAPRYPPVNCTGEDGRPMLTNVGRFLFALPSA